MPQSVTELGGGLVRDCEDITAFRIRNAIPPRIIDSPDVIVSESTGAHCTLYVPEGSRADYEAAEAWANFGAIVEEEADPNTIYRVTARSTGFGTVRLTAGDETGSTVDVRRGSEVTVEAVPAEGYALTQLQMNGEDVTAAVEDGRYTIPSVEANASFIATFSRVPVTLSLSSGEGGTMDVTVPYGDTFTLTLTPADGWTLNAAYLDGLDVTATWRKAVFTLRPCSCVMLRWLSRSRRPSALKTPGWFRRPVPTPTARGALSSKAWEAPRGPMC